MPSPIFFAGVLVTCGIPSVPVDEGQPLPYIAEPAWSVYAADVTAAGNTGANVAPQPSSRQPPIMSVRTSVDMFGVVFYGATVPDLSNPATKRTLYRFGEDYDFTVKPGAKFAWAPIVS